MSDVHYRLYSFLIVSAFLIGFSVSAQARDASTAAAASLLSPPDDGGWSLEAMMAMKNHRSLPTDAGVTETPARTEKGAEVAVLRDQVRTLQLELTENRRHISVLRRAVEMKGKALTQSEQERERLNNASSNGNAIAEQHVGLSRDEDKKSAPGISRLISYLLHRTDERYLLKAQKDHKSGDHFRKYAVLADGNQEAVGQQNLLKSLQNEQLAKDRTIQELKASLSARSEELKQAVASLATLRDEQKQQAASAVDSFDQQRIQTINDLTLSLSQKTDAYTHLQTQTDHERDVLKAELSKKETALAALHLQADKDALAMKTLQDNMFKNNRLNQDLSTALSARSDELKKAAAALAELREKHKQDEQESAPATDAQRQGYMAGIMMAEGLNKRLEGWQQAGIDTDMVMFRTGLIDGLHKLVRLKPVIARKAQHAFVESIQAGAARKVAAAQKQLTDLAKGRKPLKSNEGISWFRVRKGKPVKPGQPVTLALTEKVEGGQVVSKVPPVTLRPDDDVPSIIRNGMYLPGEGGEVVAYGMARTIYGDLPLPAGVQPFTVMEYHLIGSVTEHTVQAHSQ